MQKKKINKKKNNACKFSPYILMSKFVDVKQKMRTELNWHSQYVILLVRKDGTGVASLFLIVCRNSNTKKVSTSGNKKSYNEQTSLRVICVWLLFTLLLRFVRNSYIGEATLMLCRWLFCPFVFLSFGYCVVCLTSIYRFWLPLWYL